MQPDNSEPLWKAFQGRPNTESLLREKAEVVAELIAMSSDTGAELALDMKIPAKRFGEEEALTAKAETAVFLLHLADKIAFMNLPANDRNVFMDALETNVIAELAHDGIDPSQFTKLLQERYIEYCSYKTWIGEKDEGNKGTLFWEFAEKVAGSASPASLCAAATSCPSLRATSSVPN
jgi:hypothetical protein